MKRNPKRSLVLRFITASCLSLMLLSSVGCRGLNHWCLELKGCVSNQMVDYSNRALAEKAWIREKHHFSDRQYLKEFKDGFVKGYLDVAGGGDGCTPTLAPAEYWGWAYQTPHGQAAVGAFFRGFPYGAKAGEQDGVGYWRAIPTSGSRDAMAPYGSGVITEEIVPSPVPVIEVPVPDSASNSVPDRFLEPSMTIESPSDQPRPFEPATAGNNVEEAVDTSQELQLPSTTSIGSQVNQRQELNASVTDASVTDASVTDTSVETDSTPSTADSEELSFTFE